VETYAHAFFTWALAKHGVKAGSVAGLTGAVGAVIPDVPAFFGAAYLWDERNTLPREELLDAIYFTGPFGVTGSALHSVVSVALLLVLYRVLKLGRRDTRRILLWFLVGWFGHTVVDFLTHVDDTRPLFWPLLGWRWSSPVSYYNPLYYGREFMLVEHVGMLLIVAWLLLRRKRVRKTPTIE
jgi:membrane-bound metal-dependent hydrolase YbcI (DUF457 family)